VAVISHALWQRRFASDPAIIGKPVRMNAREFTIIGVAPAGFAGSLRGLVTDVWVPAALGSYVGMSDDFTSRGDRSALVYARLKPDVTVEQARSRMAVVARQLAAAYPETWLDVTRQGRRISVLPEQETRIPPQVRGPLASRPYSWARSHSSCSSVARMSPASSWLAPRAGSRKSAFASRSERAAAGSSARCSSRASSRR
jgi:hypothetical protein